MVTAVVGGIWIKQRHDYVVDDGNPFPNPVLLTAALSAGVGVLAALVGGGIGASVGHEDRYVVAGQ